MDKKLILAGLSLVAFSTELGAQIQPSKKNNKQNNVLFIVCDDLRTELECYNNPMVKTPNINRLATNGVVFNRAFCNIAVCMASRASFLTGMRPTRKRFGIGDLRVDKQVPTAITLNRAFREAGYITISNGKIFHHQNEASSAYWDDVMPYGNPLDYQTEENQAFLKIQQETGSKKRGMFYEKADWPDSAYMDAKVVQKSLTDLQKLAKADKPFFLAVGFIRPHLPFVAPKKYWDLYDHNMIEVPSNYVLKEGSLIPREALTHWSELLSYRGIPDEGPLSIDEAKTMIHGYYACVSYVDVLIGQLLDEVERLGLKENTTIVLIGDHGWNLGEHGLWCKHSIMETSLHAPLIVQTPDGLKGYRSNEIVEYVDLYPTFCDIASLPKTSQLEGQSLYPLLHDKEAKGKGYAVARWNNGFTYLDDKYSYTEWWDKDDQITDRMLFDHTTDPDENYNLAGKSWYQQIVDDLSRKLKAGRGENYFN
ncbi:MAG: sulfatase [Prolixibacteraceae bacterium]